MRVQKLYWFPEFEFEYDLDFTSQGPENILLFIQAAAPRTAHALLMKQVWSLGFKVSLDIADFTVQAAEHGLPEDGEAYRYFLIAECW